MTIETNVVPLRVVEGGVEMIDQRLLPLEETWHRYTSAEDVAGAIRDMVIRGAPAIGIAAAFGVAIGVRDWGTLDVPQAQHDALFELLANTRPTAVNLFWALERMKGKLAALEGSHADVVAALFAEAEAIFADDRERNLTMGRHGAALFPEGARILTHCNTGGLATGGYGTALGVIRTAHATGRLSHVWVDETRPYLQGARLTAWECMKDGIPSTLITDSMAGHLMQRGEVDAVIVGSDRIGARGHVANKIGTYALAVLCKHHGIPMYAAAPLSTFDPEITELEQIVIEQRSAQEVTHVRGQQIAPTGVQVAHPAFDVTPPELVTAIISERGVARAPYEETIAAWLGA